MAWPTVTAGQAGLASQFNALSNAIWNWQGQVNAGANPLAWQSANATWANFRIEPNSPDAALADDQLVFQYNSRTSSAGADSWITAAYLAGGGAWTFISAANFPNSIASGPHTVQTMTAATSSANASSPGLAVRGNYWNGSSSGFDLWTFQNLLGSGANPSSTLTISHSGSSGASAVSIGTALIVSGGTTFNGLTTFNASLNFNGQSIGGASTFTGLPSFNAGLLSLGSLSVQAGAAATSSLNPNSPAVTLQGNYWSGSASAADLWTVQNILGTGANPRSMLQLTHSGSTGIAGMQLGSNLQLYSTPAIAPTTASVRGDTSNNIILNGYGSGAIYLGFDSGSGVVNFCNGATSVVASMSAAGVLACAAATFSAPQSIAFGSNWVSYTPALAASGSMTVSSPGVTDAQYVRVGPLVYFKCFINGTLGGSASNTVTISLPVAAVGANSLVTAWVNTTSQNWAAGFAAVIPSGSIINVQLAGLANYPLGAVTVLVEGFYRAT